jgi:hypothetical protein
MLPKSQPSAGNIDVFPPLLTAIDVENLIYSEGYNNKFIYMLIREVQLA